MPRALASDGAEICYRAVGSGPPLILCTASFSTHLHWSGVEDQLSRDHRVVSWDYRGHGRSDAPEEPDRYSLDQVVDDLRRVHEEACDGEPAFVGGLSIGGLVSMSYYLAHPERVRALLLFNTGPGFKNPDAAARWAEMLERAAQKLEAVGVEKYLEGRRAQAELLGKDPEAPAAQALRAGILAATAAGLAHFARRVAGPAPNLVDRLHEIAVPTLILTAELDTGFHRAAEVMAARLPDSRSARIEGAGHVVNVDRPDAFVAEVRRFTGSF